MAGVGSQAQDPVAAETPREPVDEPAGRRARALGIAIEPLLMGIQPLHPTRSERHQVDAEAGVEIRDLLAQQTPHMRFITAGRAGADHHLADRPVGAIERESKAAAADAGPCERSGEVAAQPVQRGLDARRRDERIGERQARGKLGHFDERRARLAVVAERLIETPQDCCGEDRGFRALGSQGAEAAFEGGARQAIELPDGPEAEPFEQTDRVGIEPQRGNRQGGEGALCIPRRNDHEGRRPTSSQTGPPHGHRRGCRRAPPVR